MSGHPRRFVGRAVLACALASSTLLLPACALLRGTDASPPDISTVEGPGYEVELPDDVTPCDIVEQLPETEQAEAVEWLRLNTTLDFTLCERTDYG